MLFSVLMAHYNNARFLGDAIKSVLQQSYIDWEIIIVDDGSTDEFENIINDYKNDGRIKVYRNDKNRGCAFSKRKCVEKATGAVAGFLDPDDMLHTDAIKIMVAAHIQNPGCSIIHSTHYMCDAQMNITAVSAYPKALPKNTPYLLLNDGSIHAFATFKISLYNTTAGISLVNKFDKAVDQDLYYLLEETGAILFINRVLYYYRIHQGGISTYNNVVLAKMAHYTIIETACLRRISLLKNSNEPDAPYWIKQYKIRYNKIHIFNNFRQHKWVSFSFGLMAYPFNGGMKNIIGYIKKLPKEGSSLLKRSFTGN